MARGLDCRHEAHDDVHFSAGSDDELEQQVRQHRDQYHEGMTDDEVKSIVSQNAYDE